MDAHLSAGIPPAPLLMWGTPEMPDPDFAWYTVCCHLMAKSPMFVAVLLDHRPAGTYCWACAFAAGLTPHEAVLGYQHYTARKTPEDTSRNFYHLNVQTEFGRA